MPLRSTSPAVPTNSPVKPSILNNSRLLTVLLGVTAFLFVHAPQCAAAQTLHITPALVDSSEPVEQALKENAGRASTSIQGAGATLSLTYSASEAIEMYLVPLDAKNNFVPTDFLRLTLPAAEASDVDIDLTVSPGWSPGERKWILHLLTKHEEAEAGFLRLEFIPASPFGLLKAATRHFFTPEAYTPSSYHALRGYRILRTPVVPLLAVLTLILCLAAVLRAPRGTKLATFVLTLTAMSFLYQLRFGIDLLRFTDEHVRGYAEGNYDEAGSVYLLSDVLREAAKVVAVPEQDILVYVCRDGTNYKEKILRYMSYPIRISSLDEDARAARFAVVMNKKDWSVETRTEKGASVQILRCGALERPAIPVSDFPDGTILYSLSAS